MGCDNLQESEYLVPSLTTIDTHYEDQVDIAIDLLFKRIKRHDRPHEHRAVASRLFKRASTAQVFA